MGIIFLILAMAVNNEILSLVLFLIWAGINTLRLLEAAAERY